MKLATWNVNSLNVRLPRLLDWLRARRARRRVPAGNQARGRRSFPRAELEAAGYASHFAGQKTYNGVAILVREGLPRRPTSSRALPGFADEQKRVIAATVGGMRVVCFYVPNGQAVDSDKYRYKLDWCARRDARTCAPSSRAHPALAVAGDFNIAPEDRDVHDPGAVGGPGAVLGARARGVPRLARRSASPTASGCSTSRRRRSAGGITGSSRSRRTTACASTTSCCRAPLAARCTSCRIDRNARKGEKPSDHAPAIVEITAR